MDLTTEKLFGFARMVYKVDVAKIHSVEVRRSKAPRLPPGVVDSLCYKELANYLYFQLIYKVDSSSHSQIHSLITPF